MNTAVPQQTALTHNLFVNSDPLAAWEKLKRILLKIKPNYNPAQAKTAFDDISALFRGDYAGYSAIRTLYHDHAHTLDVVMCATRLLHGLHIAGQEFSDEDITLVVIACLMHDIGYAQTQDDQSGTGAQYTQCHVDRSIAFMKQYIVAHPLFPDHFAHRLEPVIRCTDPGRPISSIHFPDERTHLLGQIIGTADLAGQMADRTYLEKLLFLYLEFREAQFDNYQNTFDMLRQTQNFYAYAKNKLDGPLGNLYPHFIHHFHDEYGIQENCYLSAIEKNIAYLAEVIALGESGYLTKLKRGGIAERAQTLPLTDSSQLTPL